MKEIVDRLKSDAKFRSVPKTSRKVKIDKRFQSMFDDENKETYTVDKRGRPIKLNTTKDLRRYYHLSSSEGSSSEDEEELIQKQDDKLEEKSKKQKISDEIKKKLKNLKVDYARGEQTLVESSSDEEESEEDCNEDDTIEHKWGELDADAERTDKITSRLAVCNMDWDRIKAVDIMVILNSFLPPGGEIKSVNIYLSEFGKKRLAEEDVLGPAELREMNADREDEGDEEGSKYHMEKLRQYQLNRLKYYYAVVTFNDENSADKVYTECDGMEYESSAVKLDLRIIPEEMEFEDEPSDTCLEMPSKYQPKYFITSALQQSKVNLTWDETNPDRINLAEKINNGKLDEMDDDVWKNFIASSDEESENEDIHGNIEDRRNKYSELLKEIENDQKQEDEDDVELEATWDIGLEQKSKEILEKKDKDNEDKTPFQKYLDKKKEKRKEKRKLKKQGTGDNLEDSDIPSDIDMNDPYFAEEFNKPEFAKKKDKKEKSQKIESDENNENANELQLLLADADDKKHFSLKKIQENQDSSKKSKRKKKKNKEVKVVEDDGFKFNMDDPRFSAFFTSHLYHIDPSDPHYRKTEAMETLIKEKLKRATREEDEVSAKRIKIDDGARKNAELGLLVKNLKRKTKDMLKN